ncbi:hypothetical protein G4Y79_24075 [Phototrophicus methaneseepsis]|uniref:GP-PDE domain-containing protein n=1 Tax=Phototrophicus methaneseepsis TaxID=2710758 RepID=A0A7S8IER4_9CHLR|nr:glycerophosphodiester phosphodiesterase family protein [Phototrophicus methaneseepsis]QPC82724.1 hypothetical protein G4Y79_24075 [Phototrophicus methaneseepsis]
MANIDNGADHLPNSLEALQASLAANAAIIEIDVQVLKADDYVLLYDATLDRETNASGRVAACTVADIQSIKRKHSDLPPADGKQLATYTIDIGREGTEANLLHVLDADSITTNTPLALAAYLGQAGSIS